MKHQVFITFLFPFQPTDYFIKRKTGLEVFQSSIKYQINIVSSYLRLITYPDGKICGIYCSYIVEVKNIHRPFFCIQSSWTSDDIFPKGLLFRNTILLLNKNNTQSKTIFDHLVFSGRIHNKKCNGTSMTCAYIFFNVNWNCIKYLWIPVNR